MDLKISKSKIDKDLKRSIRNGEVLNIIQVEDSDRFEFRLTEVSYPHKPDREGLVETWLNIRVTPIEFGCITADEFIESKDYNKVFKNIINDFASQGVIIED